MFFLTVEESFDAAHSLRHYEGKCARIHGHTWKVEVQVGGKELNRAGMLIDFSVLRKMLKEILQEFDHCYLNEAAPFAEDGLNPTAENIAFYIYRRMKEKLAGVAPVLRVVQVTVFESDRARATYREVEE